MKKRIIATLAILAVFGLAAAAYAYTQNTASVATKADCCKKSDSCPMKTKGHDEKGDHAKTSCCKKHDGQAKAEGSCCDCCGDSCPMKKDGEAKATAVSTSEEKNCCDNCDCCKGKHETAA